MSIEEASMVAEKNRGKLIESENINGNYTFDEGKAPYNIDMSFCTKNNKGLYSIRYIVSGGFVKFIKQIESFKNVYGFQIFNSGTRTYMGFDGREGAQIDVYLIKNTTDDWHVNVSLFGGETPDGEFADTINYQLSSILCCAKC